MTPPVIAGAAIIVTAALPIAGYLIWLDRQIRKSAAHHAANLEAAVEAERRCSDDEEPFATGGVVPAGGCYIVGESMEPGYNPPSASMNPDAVVPPMPAGDTLTLVGAELVHRRCADARRDGRAPGQCCAARLAGVKT